MENEKKMESATGGMCDGCEIELSDKLGSLMDGSLRGTPHTCGAAASVRILAGLQEGRIVNYVMNDGAIRPLIVVNAWDRSGLVNGVLLFDGTNDNGKFPQPLTAGASGHLPDCSTWITSAHYDDSVAPAPGTWHWPSKQPVMASAVDPSAIQTIVSAMMHDEGDKLGEMLAMITRDTINAKLQAHLESSNALIDSAIASIKPMAPMAIRTFPLAGLPSGPDLDAVAADQAAGFGIEPMTGTDLDAGAQKLENAVPAENPETPV